MMTSHPGIGGQLRADPENGTSPIDVVRIAEYINTMVATRRWGRRLTLLRSLHARLPYLEGHHLPPAVVMKLDVEGKVRDSQEWGSPISLRRWR